MFQHPTSNSQKNGKRTLTSYQHQYSNKRANKPPPARGQTAQQRIAAHDEEMKRITSKALANISRAMSSSVAQIAESRDTLKKRWDLDRGLQLQDVTDQLAALNDCFSRSEEALRDSVAVIQERLLK